MDTKELARIAPIIRAKLADTRLPRNGIPRMWGGPGNGEVCDACDGTITTQEFVMEGIAEGGGGVQFHVACFYLWDSLRGLPTKNIQLTGVEERRGRVSAA